MANCNDCKSLNVVIEQTDEGKFANHVCKQYGVSVRYTAKKFNGYIWPCVECNNNGFIKK